MTHGELVQRASGWLRKGRTAVGGDTPWIGGHSVVLTKPNVCGWEQPDVIGWTGAGHSTLLEVKVSRADFFRDADKPFRAVPGVGMGNRRYYVVPEGLVKVEEVPSGWGLVEAGRKRFRVVRESESFSVRNVHAELGMLLARIRRGPEPGEDEREIERWLESIPAGLLA